MHLTQHFVDAALAAPNPSGGVKFNTGAIIGWLQTNAVYLLLAFIALGMLARAKRAKFAENTTIIGNVFLALFVLVGGAFFLAVASSVVGLAGS